MSEDALFNFEAEKHFILNFTVIAYFIMIRQVFSNVFAVFGNRE